MNGQILVLGGTGTLGMSLVDQLAADGAKFIVGGRTRRMMRVLSERGHHAVLADYNRPETLASAMHGVSAVFLLTPMVRDMACWTARAVNAARDNGVRFILRASMYGADVNGFCGLARLHGALDAAVRDSGIDCAFIRPMPYMQNFALRYAPMIRETGKIFLPLGAAALPYVDARDVAAAAAGILTSPKKHTGKAYTLTGPEMLDGLAIARIMTEVSGRQIRYVPVDDTTAEYGMSRAGMPHWNIDILHGEFQALRSGVVHPVTGDLPDLIGRGRTDFKTFATQYREVWAPAYA